MARIRSVHPGLWTDEAFVSVSPLARLFAIGLWSECDDQGVFAWKPVTLKMRILPADSVDVGLLLSELEDAGIIRRYTVDARDYGAVRNFRRFQRPKKPTSAYPVPNELRTFLGYEGTGSEPVPHHSPSGTEIAAQMEDGGGEEMEDGGGEEEGEEKNTSGVVASGRANGDDGKYAFRGQIVRLNRADFDLWRARFGELDLAVELPALDDLCVQRGIDRKRSFVTVESWLEHKNRKRAVEREAALVEARTRAEAAERRGVHRSAKAI